MTAERIDVAVIGAGLAGLTAARELRKAGRRVIVLEAQERVGGRTLNHTFADGTVVEVGGQWVGPTQDRLIALAAELGIDSYPSWDEGEHLIELGGMLKRYSDERFGLTLPTLANLGIAQMRIDRLAARASPRAAVGCPERSSTRLRDGGELGPAQRLDQEWAGLHASPGRGDLLGRARGHLDAPLPLLPAFGGQPRQPRLDHRRGAGLALRRRVAGDLDRARRGARRLRSARLAGDVGADRGRTGARRRRLGRGQRRAGRRSRSRRP